MTTYKPLLAALMTIASLALVQPAQAGTNIDIHIGGPAIDILPPPPAPIFEPVPGPRVGYIWLPGFWRWGGHRHEWVRGSWVEERPGYGWRPGMWSQRDRYWHYEPGRWEERREFREPPHFDHRPPPPPGPHWRDDDRRDWHHHDDWHRDRDDWHHDRGWHR